MALIATDGLPGPEAFGTDPAEIRLSRKELLEAAELDEAALGQLEQYGLVATRPGSNHYDGTSLVVARTVAEMSRFGIEPRHLRSFKAAADREVGLVEQVVTPLVRQRNPEAQGACRGGRPRTRGALGALARVVGQGGAASRSQPLARRAADCGVA